MSISLLGIPVGRVTSEEFRMGELFVAQRIYTSYDEVISYWYGQEWSANITVFSRPEDFRQFSRADCANCIGEKLAPRRRSTRAVDK